MQIFPGINDIRTAATRPSQAQDSGPSSAAGAPTNTATVTANDFLQLLVAEMKNQDPTANTDPSQYINQLVQVNSLEQLVQINQDLGGGATDSPGIGNGGSPSAGIASQPAAAATAGNLSAAVRDHAAATRVAGALGARGTGTIPLQPNPAGPGTGNPFETIAAAMENRANTAPTPTISPAR